MCKNASFQYLPWHFLKSLKIAIFQIFLHILPISGNKKERVVHDLQTAFSILFFVVFARSEFSHSLSMIKQDLGGIIWIEFVVCAG